MNDEPLIWTSMGNLPIASLRGPVVDWELAPEHIILTVRYFLGDEEVKKEVHMRLLESTAASAVAGQFGA